MRPAVHAYVHTTEAKGGQKGGTVGTPVCVCMQILLEYSEHISISIYLSIDLYVCVPANLADT